MISKIVQNVSSILHHKSRSMNVVEASTNLNEFFFVSATTLSNRGSGDGPPCIDSVSDYICLNSTQVILIAFTGSIFFLAGCIHLIIYNRRAGRASGSHQTTGTSVVRSHNGSNTTTTARMTLSVLQDVPPRYSQIFSYNNDMVTTVDELPPAYDTVVTVTVRQTSYNLDKLLKVHSVPGMSSSAQFTTNVPSVKRMGSASARIENNVQHPPSSAIFAIDPAQLESGITNFNANGAQQTPAPNGRSDAMTIV